MADVCAHLVIRGRVQGVSFRYYTYHQALLLGLKGWVRNRPNGSVEALFQGNRAVVEKMIEWCRQGPPIALVDNVEVKWQDINEDLREFSIRF